MSAADEGVVGETQYFTRLPYYHWCEKVTGANNLRETPATIRILNRIEERLPAEIRMVRGGTGAAETIIGMGLEREIISIGEAGLARADCKIAAANRHGRGARKSLERPTRNDAYLAAVHQRELDEMATRSRYTGYSAYRY